MSFQLRVGTEVDMVFADLNSFFEDQQQTLKSLLCSEI